MKETLRRLLVVGCYVGAFAWAIVNDPTFLQACGIVVVITVLHKCANWIFQK